MESPQRCRDDCDLGKDHIIEIQASWLRCSSLAVEGTDGVVADLESRTMPAVVWGDVLWRKTVLLSSVIHCSQRADAAAEEEKVQTVRYECSFAF